MSNQINVTIAIPESYTMDNLGAELGRSFNADQLSALLSNPEVLFNAAMNGISNKLKDSHAGITYKSFKTEAEGLLAKKTKIESTFASLMAGEWRLARESAPSVAREIMVGRTMMLAALSKDSAKKVNAMESDAKNTKLDELLIQHAEKITPTMIAAEIARIDAELERKAKAKAELASLVGKIELNV